MPAIARSLTRPDPIAAMRWAMAGLFLMLACALPVRAAQIEDFAGVYEGSADVENVSGEVASRDMSVEITVGRKSFTVAWTTVTYRGDGRVKESSYTIDFVPSAREDVFAAAMGTNVFGHSVQLDPMEGDPYVWGQLLDDTLTVYSLFIGEYGGYEMQEYHRTLVDGGLQLEFNRFRNGEKLRSVNAFLARQD